MAAMRPKTSSNRRMPALSIRARLLFAYVGLLLIGFAFLTIVMGEQIAVAARSDYEQRILNTIQLVARGISPYVGNPTRETTDTIIENEELIVVVESYELQLGAEIQVIILSEQPNPDDQHGDPRDNDITAALRGELRVTERSEIDGSTILFTAAPIMGSRGRNPVAVVQLSVPASNLREVVFRRWLDMWMVFGVVLLFAVIISLVIARSILRPLYTLRASALRLAQGDLDHRVANPGGDEIGAVAAAFNEMAEQVQSMLEEQRAFASNTSHELRTPLTAIRLRSEAMRHDTSLDEATAKQYIIEIDDETRRLGALVEDLTLLSRFDAGRAELGGSEIDLVRFAHSLIQSAAVQAKSRQVAVSLTAPDDPIPVRASLTHLTVVFRNLLDNAIKFTPEGGRVTWTMRLDENHIINTISDTGQGIDADHLPHVFERFYRADRARSRNVPGTGLGLALVKSIVDAYGGTVTIDSAGHGEGTTVTVVWNRTVGASSL